MFNTRVFIFSIYTGIRARAYNIVNIYGGPYLFFCRKKKGVFLVNNLIGPKTTKHNILFIRTL